MIKFLNMEEILKEIQQVLSKIDEKNFEILEDLILKSNKIFVYGSGRSGFIGRCFAMRLFHLGFNSYFAGETITPSYGENDLIIFISASGEKTIVNEMAKKCKSLNGKVVAITSNKENSLSKISDFSIIVPVEKSVQIGNSLFEQATFIFLEGFIHFYKEKHRIENSEIEKRHTNLE